MAFSALVPQHQNREIERARRRDTSLSKVRTDATHLLRRTRYRTKLGWFVSLARMHCHVTSYYPVLSRFRFSFKPKKLNKVTWQILGKTLAIWILNWGRIEIKRGFGGRRHYYCQRRFTNYRNGFFLSNKLQTGGKCDSAVVGRGRRQTIKVVPAPVASVAIFRVG